VNLNHFSTKERLLSAAEQLFAEHGFAATSLRQLTACADVNIAAVNYHFGSKENLITEVFRRRFDELTARRMQLLQAAVEADPTDLDAILAAFIRPAMEIGMDGEGAAFVRVVARAYAEKNERLRKFLSDNYGHVLREFARAIQRCLPQLPKQDLYWRLDFIAGALTYAMADFGLIRRPHGVSEQRHCELAADNLLRFAVAGLRAPAAFPTPPLS
jgi:AcrR family transcriptional regulator